MKTSPQTPSPQQRKLLFSRFSKAVAGSLLATFALSSQVYAQDVDFLGDVNFLQDIQNQLTRGYNIKGRIIHVYVTREHKRKIDVTPSSISFSYGFLKNMDNINQLVATMAHMTAHINLDYVSKSPLPEYYTIRPERKFVENFMIGRIMNGAIKQQYPDESYMPEAKGSFQENRSEIITRPHYQNKDYTYAVNKADIITKEHELEVDKITDKIMKRVGFCPQDYSRLLHYFYENPQRLMGNKHFPLEANQWQRIDTVDRKTDPDAPCSDAQIALTQKYADAFNQLKGRILVAGNTRKTLMLSRSFGSKASPVYP